MKCSVKKTAKKKKIQSLCYRCSFPCCPEVFQGILDLLVPSDHLHHHPQLLHEQHCVAKNNKIIKNNSVFNQWFLDELILFNAQAENGKRF